MVLKKFKKVESGLNRCWCTDFANRKPLFMHRLTHNSHLYITSSMKMLQKGRFQAIRPQVAPKST